MNADLEHLTRVVPTGTIFLDSDLRLMRFSPDTVKIFRLRDGDVGRPLADLTHVMDYPDLIDEIGNATFTGRSSDREVSTQDGRRYLVRILPYAMPSEPNRSVVLLFVDVTDSKTAMTLRAILDSLIESAVVLDSRGIIRHANARWLRFGAENGADLRLISPGADYLRGWTLPEEGAGEPYRRAARDGIVAVLEGRRDSFSLEYPCDSPTARRWFLLEARALPEGIGGAVVFVASKNGLAASPNASAYCTAKAAEIHLARCLALEGAEAGIRVNVVNPDAVLKGSKIWSGEWLDQRAATYKTDKDGLEEMYRQRSMLKRSVLPEDIAEGVYFLASDLSAKSTGNILNVDAGNKEAFTR